MPICVAFGVLALYVAVAVIRRLPEPVDPVWKPTGIAQKFAGYDQGKAEAAARRNGQTAAQMALRDRKPKAKSNVVPLRKTVNS